jgi:hypothetical protein
MTSGTVLLTAFYVVMVASLCFAWFRGGGAERASAVLILAFTLLRFATVPIQADRFDALDPLALAEDFLAFAGFTWIALRARRYWPLFAAALQLLSLAGHFARAVDLGVDPYAYALMKSVPTLLVFVTLVIGTANYQRRKRATMHAD